MMIKLKKVEIEKYKCIESKQVFDVDDKITVLVGMNESGKTSALEALAKSNYFQNDSDFLFNKTHDYPRKEKKTLDKSGNNPIAIKTFFSFSDEIIIKISDDIGRDTFDLNDFFYSRDYENIEQYQNLNVDMNKFLDFKFKQFGLEEDELKKEILTVNNSTHFDTIINSQEKVNIQEKLKELSKYFSNEGSLYNPIEEYLIRIYLKPCLPKFLYYDEYYLLPSDISIEKLYRKELDKEELKTANALLELADINTGQLINSNEYENYKAELEATQSMITDELFKYWSTNTNLSIEFDIDKIISSQKNQHNHTDQIIEHILKIRVKNHRSAVTLPLKNRSKGFNWFFSFLVWFKKIQEDKSSNYVLLLDEPGLNLHAKAQEDLLRFFEDLSKDYQIIYTTHSPFMIEPNHLDRVRTVVETKTGTIISDSVQEKDPNTLFPLQAALGYDIAQNLFISKYNLLVEGVSDLIYLTVLSSILESLGRIGLNQNITIVPVGGLDKVASFISLLRGNKLKLVCLLDSFMDSKGKARVDDLIKGKIIEKQFIKFFDEFVNLKRADIEDLFKKEEYLLFYNGAYQKDKDFQEIKLSDLNQSIENIIIQINTHLNVDRFNHYRPANYLAGLSNNSSVFSVDTLNNFENMFKELNKLFDVK